MRRHVLTAFVFLAGAAPALADAIDGDWCAIEGGKMLSIEGANIRTPGGKTLTGSYRRHSFSYIAPDGDWQAGSAIDMQQLGETRMRMTIRGGGDSQWRRCPPGVS